jgi:serine/threonine-protein kinase
VLGTSNYIAPEQASGQPIDERSDVYSLGVVLFELLAGEVPFVGENFVAVAMKHVHEPAPSVLERRPDTPPRLARLIDAMLAKHHGDRPAMDEVVAELERLRGAPADSQATAVIRRPQPSRRGRPARRRPVWPMALAAAGAIVLGVAFGAFILRDAGDPGDGASGNGAIPIALEPVGTEDPRGDGEHDGEVPNAVDNVPATYWQTSSYDFPNGEFGKEGVGIVLRASRPPEELVVATDTPGFTAEIRSGGERISESQTVEGETTFALPDDSEATELVVFITNRGPHRSVHITEVTAR